MSVCPPQGINDQWHNIASLVGYVSFTAIHFCFIPLAVSTNNGRSPSNNKHCHLISKQNKVIFCIITTYFTGSTMLTRIST